MAVDDERPVRIDAYLEGLELDVDAVTDGVDVLIPGLIEHVERAGVHSGDSIGVYPPQRISDRRPGSWSSTPSAGSRARSACAA